MRTLLLSLALCAVLAGCRSAPPSSPATPANQLGDQALQEGRFKQAIEYYARWLVDHPRDFQALYRRGIALEAVGEAQLALESYTRTLELRPDHLTARMRRASAHYRAGALDQADQDLNEVMGDKGFDELHAHDQVLCYGLAGQIALGKGHPGIALDHLDRAIDTAQKHKGEVRAGHLAALLHNRATALFGLNAFQMALEDYEGYLKLQQEQGAKLTSTDAYHLVLLNYLSGKFDQASKGLPLLSRGERQQLAAQLDDPGFFLGDPVVAATTTSKR